MLMLQRGYWRQAADSLAAVAAAAGAEWSGAAAVHAVEAQRADLGDALGRMPQRKAHGQVEKLPAGLHPWLAKAACTTSCQSLTTLAIISKRCERWMTQDSSQLRGALTSYARIHASPGRNCMMCRIK